MCVKLICPYSPNYSTLQIIGDTYVNYLNFTENEPCEQTGAK